MGNSISATIKISLFDKVHIALLNREKIAVQYIMIHERSEKEGQVDNGRRRMKHAS
jgi:hypothetical protein